MNLRYDQYDPRIAGQVSNWMRLFLKSDYSLVGFLFALQVLANFGQFEYLSRDDLFFKNADHGAYALALANYVNGRFVPGFAYYLFSYSDYDLAQLWVYCQVIVYLIFAIFAFVFVNRLGSKSSFVGKSICASIIVLFPYNITFVHNNNNQLNAIFALIGIIGAIIFFLNEKRALSIAGSSLFLFITAASYQTTIYYFIVFVWAYHLFHGDNWQAVWRGLLRGAAVCFIALALYALLYHALIDGITAAIVRTRDPGLIEHFGKLRSASNDWSGLTTSIPYFLAAIGRVLIYSEPIVPLILKALGVNVILFAMFLWRSEAGPGLERDPATRFMYRKRLVLLFAVPLILSSPIHLYIMNNWIGPRVLMHVAAIWGALFLLSMEIVPRTWHRAITLAVSIFALGAGLAMAYTNDGIYVLYQRDLRLARSIVDDLKSTENFEPLKPLAIEGYIGVESPHVSGLPNYFDMNASKFNFGWSKYAILEEVSGTKYVRPNGTFRRYAESACRAYRDSERQYRNIVTAEGAVICFPDAKRD